MVPRQIFRAKKLGPCRDFWQTLRLGLPISLVLFLILPRILG